MNKVIMIAACAAAVAGCQTRITAEKHAETANPIQAKVTVNGEDRIINTGYTVTSGGWYATARSPLYAKEELKGLSIGVQTNGSVNLSLGEYQRDLSTNAIVMVKTIFDGSANLVDACAKAYASIQTAGATTAAGSVAEKIAKYFKSKGGNAAKSTVTANKANKTVTVTDGITSIVCDEAGNCTDCVGDACSDVMPVNICTGEPLKN